MEVKKMKKRNWVLVTLVVLVVVVAMFLFGFVPTRYPKLQWPVVLRWPVKGWVGLWATPEPIGELVEGEVMPDPTEEPEVEKPPARLTDEEVARRCAEGNLGSLTVGRVFYPCPQDERPEVPALPEKVPPSVLALKYDEEGCQDQVAFSDCLSGQAELAAHPVRRAQEAVWNAADDKAAQEAMAAAVKAVQDMASETGAERHEADPLELDFGTTYLVWCSNAAEAEVPADVAMPLRPDHLGWGQLYVWAPPAHYEDAPDPSLTTFSGCVDSDFWAVALR